MGVAIVTGGSRGLGRALAGELVRRDWSVVLDGRDGGRLARVVAELTAGRAAHRLVGVAGDVSDEGHRAALVRAAEALGGLDLLVNNASTLGPLPMRRLADYPIEALDRVLAVNVLAPLALVQDAIDLLRSSASPVVVDVSSDAGAEHYPGWGGYGASKAALDHLTLTLAEEEPWLRFVAVDPGDMRTDMHQDAFPGEDISDRPEPASVVPRLLAVVEDGGRFPSGRYRLSEVEVLEPDRAGR